jgi:Uma2 family endonuclease
MGKLQTVPSPATALHGRHLPRLETGDHLDQATFHARYAAMPPDFRAELIGGVVFVPSPLRLEHGVSHALVMGWLIHYWIATPGTQVWDNATAILGDDSEPQPDAVLIIEPHSGGRTSVSEDGYATGPPELIVDVASSSESIDLHRKRRDYEQAGVLEYVVVVLRQRVVRWFVLQDGTYREVEADAQGLFKSSVFPGLWLDTPALLRLDGRQVMATLQHGIETPEHAACSLADRGHQGRDQLPRYSVVYVQ